MMIAFGWPFAASRRIAELHSTGCRRGLQNSKVVRIENLTEKST
jgi:hypothetical protein